MTATFRLASNAPDAGAWQRMLSAIEAALRTEPLRHVMTAPLGTDVIEQTRPHAVDDPGAWCVEHFNVKPNADPTEVGYISNGIEHELVTVGPMYAYPQVSVPGDRVVLHVCIDSWPPLPKFIARLPALMQTFGPAAGALWGDAATLEAAGKLARGVGRISPDPGSPLPLDFPPPPSVLIPSLGWVCWWSDATCQYLRFSPDDPRASLFARVIPVPGHGLVLQLTDEVLDLEKPEHLAAVTAVYRAFPEIDQKWAP